MNALPSPRVGESYVEPPQLDPADQKGEPNEQELLVVETAKPIFNPPIPEALIPHFYRLGMRVHVPQFKMYGHITAVAKHTLHIKWGEKKVLISHAAVAPSIPIDATQRVCIYPAENRKHFGKMVKQNNLHEFIIDFDGQKRAIPRMRIWPVENDAHKDNLIKILKSIGG